MKPLQRWCFALHSGKPTYGGTTRTLEMTVLQGPSDDSSPHLQRHDQLGAKHFTPSSFQDQISFVQPKAMGGSASLREL